jgi:hypothetical protein
VAGGEQREPAVQMSSPPTGVSVTSDRCEAEEGYNRAATEPPRLDLGSPQTPLSRAQAPGRDPCCYKSRSARSPAICSCAWVPLPKPIGPPPSAHARQLPATREASCPPDEFLLALSLCHKRKFYEKRLVGRRSGRACNSTPRRPEVAARIDSWRAAQPDPRRRSVGWLKGVWRPQRRDGRRTALEKQNGRRGDSVAVFFCL